MFLGIDTSNYTTSLCVVDQGHILFEKRALLKVKSGSKGLRQSDAFYQHMHTLQTWLPQVLEDYRDVIKAVGVSTRPREVEGSYMPVFNAGKICADILSSALQLPCYAFSHQEGHFHAALESGQVPIDPVLFCHLSGGTSEIHLAKRSPETKRVTLERVYETNDISFGQLIDRIGVEAGLAFPCGKAMDDQATLGPHTFKIPKFKLAQSFNLSGYENVFKTLLTTYPEAKDEVYYALFHHIYLMLKTMILAAVDQTACRHIVVAGGVAASQNIRRFFQDDFILQTIDVHFAPPAYASDNAYGIALLAQSTYHTNLGEK